MNIKIDKIIPCSNQQHLPMHQLFDEHPGAKNKLMFCFLPKDFFFCKNLENLFRIVILKTRVTVPSSSPTLMSAAILFLSVRGKTNEMLL